MALILDCGECREVAQQYVVEALGHPAVAYVDFVFGCLRVNGWNMRAVANMVGKGSIGASLDLERKTMSPGAAGEYNPGTNAIKLGKFDASIVVHEAIHALQDGVRYPTRVTQAEATAYLGQAAYAIAREAESSGSSLDAAAVRFEQRASAIHAAAARVARRIGMLNRCQVVVHGSDLVEIEQAIARSPVYSGHANADYPFDGYR